MDDSDIRYRRALVEHHRRTAVAGALGAAAWLPLTMTWRIRRARATGDPWAWATIALAGVSLVANSLAGYHHAEADADRDLARENQARENQAALQRGEVVPLSAFLVPAPRTPVGCLAQLVVLGAGSSRACWRWARRPDRGRAVVGWRWHPRPGPAWWTALSFQQLPVNAASTAPRAAQIAYQRRQLRTREIPGLASTAITAWETHLRSGAAERDWLRISAGVLRILLPGVRLVADHRLVPARVDAQRARRRHHDTAVAELVAARAAGRPGPRNPWRADVLLAGATVGALAGSSAVQIVMSRRRPRRPADASASG